MIRERYIVLVPGKHTAGMSAWIAEDGVLTRMAAGPVKHSVLGPWVRKFTPDEVILERPQTEKYHPTPIIIPDVHIRFAHPRWKYEDTPYPIPGKLGEQARWAWRVGISEFVRRGKYRLGPTLDLQPLTIEWIEDNSPRKLHEDH